MGGRPPFTSCACGETWIQVSDNLIKAEIKMQCPTCRGWTVPVPASEEQVDGTS